MNLSQWFDHIDGSSSLVIEWQRAMTAIPAMGPESGGDGRLGEGIAAGDRI